MAPKLTKRYLNIISIKLDKKEREASDEDKRGYTLLKMLLDYVLSEACSEKAIQDFFSTIEEVEKEL